MLPSDQATNVVSTLKVRKGKESKFVGRRGKGKGGETPKVRENVATETAYLWVN